MTLLIDAEGRVRRSDGARFDSARWRWGPAGRLARGARAATAVEALRAAARGSPQGPRPPIGVIGGRTAPAATLEIARALGRRIGESGLPLLCGGKSGVMAAACEGARAVGGLTIGLLPDNEWTGANPHVVLPIATGIGVARNAVIARACPALIAIGGGYGTLSEMAFGLQFGRLVLALAGAPRVEGALRPDDVEQAMALAAARMLGVEAD